MRALATRELVVATRNAAVPIAALAVLSGLSAFVLTWAPGVPTLATMNLYEQTRAVHWVLLSAVLPWTAVRCSPVDRREAIVLMASLIRTRPGVAVVAKVLGSAGVLMLIVATGLPPLVLAQQAAAVPMVRVLTDLLPLCGLALLVAASAAAAMLIAADGVRAWIWTSVVVLGVLLSAAGWTSELSLVGWLCAAAGMAGTAMLSAVMDGSVLCGQR